ncbi:MAG: asparagine synthase (glutamine-hydrolyzing) [Candidatus Sungbacteria bacterium]|nr:asparagine synthase (glutamine-hydrolyzing) [Candidatus Sungbacteria bacterium]
MCGVAGIVTRKPNTAEKSRLEKMIETMPYRGPNDRGTYFDDNALLGHLRLSIIDLSPEGRNPLFDASGDFCIIFNGEIYNYVEIRDELRQSGISFRTKTDTEVVLESYKRWGDKCVAHFNGMWAFAIWDKRRKRLFVSRDRFGVKPLFYAMNDDELLFASEVKGILAARRAKAELNETFLYHYLDRHVPFGSNETVFQGIHTLLPAHNLIWENGKVHIERYWRFEPDHFRRSYDYRDPTHTFRDLLVDSVKLRLRSDVPVGVCLSGGIDSSIIVGIITKILGQEIDTFSSVYREKDYTEEEFIDAVNVAGRTRPHKIYPDAKNLFPVLEKLIRHHDEPVRMPSTFSQWHVFQCAKENVTVTLDGQGADELLGGYRYYYPSYLATLIRDGMLGNPRKLRLAYEARRDLKRYVGSSYGRDTLKMLTPDVLLEVKRLFSPHTRWQETVLSRDFVERAARLLPETPRMFSDLFTQHLYETFTTTNLPMVLDFEDRISMAFSLEARTPFLDYRVVEFCFGLPYEEKMQGYRNKVILREAFRDVIPERVYNRKDKKGFPTPNEHWFRNELREELGEIFHSKLLKERGIFDAEKVRSLFERHCNGENHERILWRVIATELWMRMYFD